METQSSIHGHLGNMSDVYGSHRTLKNLVYGLVYVMDLLNLTDSSDVAPVFKKVFSCIPCLDQVQN